MIDKSSLLKSQGSLYLEFIPKDGLFHKMLLLSLMGFLTGWCNLYVPEVIIHLFSLIFTLTTRGRRNDSFWGSHRDVYQHLLNAATMARMTEQPMKL